MHSVGCGGAGGINISAYVYSLPLYKHFEYFCTIFIWLRESEWFQKICIILLVYVCVGGGGFNLGKLFFGHFHAFHVSVCVSGGGALVAGEGGDTKLDL